MVGNDNGLKVVACPTTGPYSSTALRPRLPDSTPPSIAGGLRTEVAVYANNAMFVLAPSGWQCTASEGLDGNDTITVYPQGQSSTNPTEAVSGTTIPACAFCIWQQACAYFPAARKIFTGYGPCPRPPAAEQHVQTRPTNVDFADPPGVAGSGFASGGANPANGVQVFVSKAGDQYAARETCTLPQSQHALCTAILDDFIKRYAEPKPQGASGSSASSSPVGPTGRRYAVLTNLPIRAGASTSASRIGQLPSGAMVGVQCKQRGEIVTGPWGHDRYWDQITFRGVTGFVTDEWVDTKSDETNPTRVPLC